MVHVEHHQLFLEVFLLNFYECYTLSVDFSLIYTVYVRQMISWPNYYFLKTNYEIITQ